MKPGPKPCGEQVVRAPARLLVRLRALVGRPETDEERRRREREDGHDPDREDVARVGGDEAAPAGHERLLTALLGVVDRLDERDLQPVDLVPELGENGQKQRVGDQHRGQNAESAPDPELRDEVEAEEREPAHRDRDGQAGKEHRTAGRRSRLGRRVVRREAVVQKLSEARDDEERVVDADAEPDHRDEDRRDRVDVGETGEDEEEQERRDERREREGDRNDHRHERAEDEDEDDDRREHAEQLRGALLERRELGLAVVLDGHADGGDRLADGVLDGDDRISVLVLDRLVELRLGVGDAPVVGERVRAERVARALDAGLVGRGRVRRGLDERDRLLDRGLALGRVEPLARRCGEDDVEDAALLGRELRLDQVGRALRVGAGDLELVAQAAAHRDDEADEHDEDPDPADDHAPRVRGAESRPARPGARGEAFVCAWTGGGSAGGITRHRRGPFLVCGSGQARSLSPGSHYGRPAPRGSVFRTSASND